MNIYARKGDRVEFLGENGYSHDQEHARKFMKPGDIVTVERTMVGGWHTDVMFQEHPGQWFNSVMFRDVALKTEQGNQND